MQNIGKLTIVILTILVTLAEPLVKGTTRAAPQGKELYEEHEVEKRALLDKEKSSQTITEAEKPKTIVIYSSHGRTDLEIEVGEATDEPPQLAIVDPDQNQHQPKDRNLKTRQTQEEVNQDEIDLNDDEFVASLIRRGKDFIAAAGMAESPRPVQAMRLNMNSGL